MSRPARVLSQTGMYHIIFRGINRQNLFECDKDFAKMEEIIAEVKAEKGFELYAYCLMTNHVHLFIRELNSGDITKIMHKILTKYVGWFNFKYERSGSLIGNRYKSEPIEDDTYYLQLVRYIHHNPLKAGMVEKLEDYSWSSYGDYTNPTSSLTDVNFIFSMLNEDIDVAIELFKEFHNDLSYEDFTISDGKKLTDAQLKRKAEMLLDNVKLSEIYLYPKPERDKLLNVLRQNEFTIGQLERLTGISRGIITRAK